MEEMNHFSHKDHPLKLIENLEMIVDGGGYDCEEKHEHVYCYGCREPILGGSTYGCIPCHYFLHKTCAQLEPNINHHLHFKHPLTLIALDLDSSCICNVCDQRLVGVFEYRCLPCYFDVCMKCAAAAAALQETANVKFEHEGHPQHTLTFQLRRGAFLCDACNTKDEDFFYRCNDCTFWIHKTCATLCPKIDLSHHHKHPLFLAYSLPDNFYNFLYYCEFCKKLILRSYWAYHCANCRYFAHIKCALNADQQPSTPRDGQGASHAEEQANDHDILHFPMSNAFTDPLKLLHFEKITLDDDGAVEINHWSHDHPLILNVEPQGNNMPDINYSDPIEVCHCCVRPLSLPYYGCKDGCSFTLHKYCAELPHNLGHQLHPNHLLKLAKMKHLESYRKCNGCFSFGNTFIYWCKTCKFYLDVNCAFLPNTIKHKSHHYPLSQVIDPKTRCNTCEKTSSGISYACKACNFQLDMYCAVRLPHALVHRYCKGHQIPFTYTSVEDHPEDFYCDICELEMHPKLPLHYCHKCKNSFHLHCLNRIDYYANIWQKVTTAVSYHKHPLTYVRRKKTPKYVCSNCNRDLNGFLILECRARVCNFNICYQCHRRKRQ